jgi:hypothetical protein
MGGRLEQHLALGQSLAHQPEFVIFEIAQTAMDIFAGARTRPLREIVFFAEYDGKTSSSGIARDARTIDAAANDQEIDRAPLHHGLSTG